MKNFLDTNFLLQTETASTLYQQYAKTQPIFDFHNHLSAQEIYENKSLGNLVNAWLDHDHYKWRAMRAFGIDEKLITGHLNKDGSVKSIEERGGKDVVEKLDFERFIAFVQTLQNCIGNPLYHWCHLELADYFGIREPLTEQNAKDVWNKCNELLADSRYFPRGLLEMQNVKALCTTDDPCDDLKYHKLLAQDWKNCLVLPSFRPDLAVNCENEGFSDYIAKLEKVSGVEIKSVDDVIEALAVRMDLFKSVGSVVSDHSLECDFYSESDLESADEVFKIALSKRRKLTVNECAKYKTYVLSELGKKYAEKGFVIQIHIGALRDNNSCLFDLLGKNIGVDSLHDFNFMPQLSGLLNLIYKKCGTEHAPKVILYNLNPKDNEALAAMAVNFRNCVFGPAWWFNDHKDGIEQQMRVYSRTSVLGNFIGMLTDSRSFLSFPRHEYFRRILCNYVGDLVENGEFPADEKLLGKMIERISYINSIKFFGIEK